MATRKKATGAKRGRPGTGKKAVGRPKRRSRAGKPATTGKGTDIDPVSGDRLLFDSEDDVPKNVATLAGAYEKALTASNKAKAKEKGTKASLLDAMIEAGVGRIPIRGGKEWIVVEDESKIAIRKPEKKGDDEA